MRTEQEIVLKFLDLGLQVHPDVVAYIADQQDLSLVDRTAQTIPEGTVVVMPRHIPGFASERDGMRILTESEVDVVQGSRTAAGGGVDFRDFVHYFRNRYDQLAAPLRKRKALADIYPVEALTRTTRYYNSDVAVIGMVVDVRNTTKGHRMVHLEDPTGEINILFNKDREPFAEAERIIPDEVIGVRGKLSSDGNLLFADSFHRPDVPMNNGPTPSETPGKVALISDVHVGSDTFLEEAWNRFSEWLTAHPEVGYLLIAGDLVDGIGIYPGQDKELTIPNIYGQYEVFAEMMRKLPSHLQIVISPGNHDVVRGSEPQPALPEHFCEHFPDNAVVVENPALVNLQGVNILMYHGRSYDDMIGMIPGASYTRPEEIMVEMLKRRHLACTYGQRTPILAAKEDRLVIDPVPEILHTGHVHICGIANYRGVLCVNSGTWQSQTSFQKQMNIQPTPARAVIVDLQTLKPEVVDFSGNIIEA